MTDAPHNAGQRRDPHEWPADPSWLTDTTRCPACFSRLSAPYCTACALDLRGPRAAELLAASTDLVTAEGVRQRLIAAMRDEQAAAQATRAAQPAFEQAPAFRQPATLQQSAASNAPARPPRKHSSVQIALLIVGVSLVSIAAIFFLTVAWLVTGLAVRSLIVGALTVTALLVAALLRRKQLTATAEGIGVAAVVLVILDVWAIRSNNMFGAADIDGLSYWGWALLACTSVFLLSHALTNLRVASVAGFALVAPASGLLVAGLSTGLDGAASTLLASLAAAVATLAYRATVPTQRARWPQRNRATERVILFVFLIASVVLASFASWFVQPQNEWAPAWWAPLIVAVLALHIAVWLRMRRHAAHIGAIPSALACFAVIALASVVPQLAVRAHNATLTVTVSTLVVAALVLALESLVRGMRATPARSVAFAAAVTGATLAGCQLAATVAVAAVPTVEALEHGMRGAGNPAAAATPQAINWWALLTLLGVAALIAVAWLFQGILRRRMPVLVWCGAGVITLTIPFSARSLPITVASITVAAISTIVLIVNANGALRIGRLRPALLALMIATTALGYLVSWGSSDTWWIGSIGAIVIVFSARFVAQGVGRSTVRATLLPATALLIVIAGGAAPWMLTLDRSPDFSTSAVNILGGIAVSTAVLQLVTALPWRRGFSPPERRSTFWFLLLPSASFVVLLFPFAGHAASGGNSGMFFPEPVGSLSRASVLLVAVLLWLMIRRNRTGLRRERLVAIAALGPVLAMTGSAAAGVAAADATAHIAVIAAAGLLACAAGLVLCLVGGAARSKNRGPSRARDRVVLELGAAVTIAWAAGVAAAFAPDATWLVLLLAGAVFLLAAIDTDGLFASHSLRRHLGWTALALGVATLWTRLGGSNVDVLEPYLLPVAAALLVLAVLVGRFGSAAQTEHASAGAAALVLAGLTVAIVPLAVVATTDDILRPVIVGSASALLLLAASTLRWSPRSTAYFAAMGLPGALGVVLVFAGRIDHAVGTSTNLPWIVDTWLVISCVVLISAGFLLVRHSHDAARDLRERSGAVLVITAVLLVAIGEHVAAGQGFATTHIVILVWVLAAAHALALWARRPPLTALVGWLSIALALIATAADGPLLAPTPLEIVTVPMAIALLLSGALQLGRTAAARSWPWLGPGVAALLVPSLVIGFTDDALWRLVALGVVAIGVLITGLLLRLQAPFLLGCLVVLIHAGIQLWPWISAAYEATQWWMWLGAGGIILIVLAARYEKRIRDIRSIALRISMLHF